MNTGLYRATKPIIGDCVRMNWTSNPESFLTRDTYDANRHHPPFDDLPSEEEYLKLQKYFT